MSLMQFVCTNGRSTRVHSDTSIGTKIQQGFMHLWMAKNISPGDTILARFEGETISEIVVVKKIVKSTP